MTTSLPVRVAAVDDYELVVSGLANMLGRFGDRIEVADRIVIGDPIEGRIDVALFDTYGRVGALGQALGELVSSPGVQHVAVFSLDLSPELVVEGRAAGATGFISKALTAQEIADAIVRVAGGEVVITESPALEPSVEGLEWPGRADGLSERESQVLVLAAEGLSNREIAQALYLGQETVKSYLRQVFAKLDLRNRVEAAKYVHRSGAFARYQPADSALSGEPPRTPDSEPPTS